MLNKLPGFILISMPSQIQYTVNSEIFAMVLFSHMPSFVKVKSLRNGKNILSVTDIGKSCVANF